MYLRQHQCTMDITPLMAAWWKCLGKLLVWDATCSDTFAASNVRVAVTKSSAMAEKAEQLKVTKYIHLDFFDMLVAINWDQWCFVPLLLLFLQDCGHRLRSATKEPNSFQCHIQRLSVAIQRGNAESVLGTIGQHDGVVDFQYHFSLSLFIQFVYFCTLFVVLFVYWCV